MLTQVADKILDEISDPSADFVVVVEGVKDEKALRRLGVLRVEVLNRYENVVDLADKLWEKGVRRAVILTDYDRTGRILAKKIAQALQSGGIRVNWKLRAKIREVFRITYIETLDRVVEAMERGDWNGKDLHRLRKVPRSRKY